MKYDEVLSRAWKIVWRFKALWVFGVLASCARASSGSSGSSSGGGGGSSLLPQSGVLAAPDTQFPRQIYQWMLTFQRTWEAEPWVIILIILALFSLVFVLVVVGMFAGTMGRVGVVRGAWLAEEGEEKLGFGRIWRASLPYFWRVFFLILLTYGVITLVISVLLVPFILLTVLTAGVAVIILLPILLPFSLLALVFFFGIRVWIEQTIVAIVGENLGLFAAMERAWKLLIAKPWPQLVIGLIVTIGEGVVSFALIIPFFLVFLPFLVSILFETKVALTIGAGLSGLTLLVYLPIVFAACGLMYAYIGAVWTLTFRQLTTEYILSSELNKE
jgi:hypothetical protein